MGYFANAAQILIQFVFGAIIGLFVLRMLAEAVRADFYNPICQFLYRTTNPVLTPMRRVVPTVNRVNLAALLVAWLVEVLKLVLLFALAAGVLPGLLGLVVMALAELIDFLLVLYLALVFAWALMSFLSVDSGHPLIPLVGRLVEPLLRPLRRRLPMLGGLDFSPAVAMLAIVLARVLLVDPLFDIGRRLAL
ncbi:MAG TPA: YggT family protein [Mizugakiibacter sp.]